MEAVALAANGFSFTGLADGPADGPLVLALHGFPQSSHEWRATLARLGAAGHRAVAPDQRGYSPGPPPTEVEAYPPDAPGVRRTALCRPAGSAALRRDRPRLG